MKIVCASTPEQENYIEELIQYIYSEIFPLHFSDEYIIQMEAIHVLVPREDELHYNGTMKEAFQLISSLQALIAVMETVQYEMIESTHEDIFSKNVSILNEYGYSFPFTLNQFSNLRNDVISKYSKPTNLYLA
ncbi:DUF5365 family protein [Litchfieldia salsa]|uniref:YhcU family protein n=1 Tax=Litchfieldia salsa TaxID=930152 RepID=A0A1H0WSH0_9BACI|nr:DUF5365 family protein [Litchfieldia salsa]SDP93623.1 hypothetical protein SAMN05216565_1154 [Litchfieldia salsa]